MNSLDVTRLTLFLIGCLFVLVLVLKDHWKKSEILNVKFITRTAIFGAMSTILYIVPIFTFTLPIFPPFLSIHLDEIPALIAAYAYGPLSGIIIIVIKTIIKLPMTSTLCVGELADLIYSLAFIVPSALIYKKYKSFKGSIISLVTGSAIQMVVASIFTAFVMLDFYMFVYSMPKESILEMCHLETLGWNYVLFIGLPFNAIKDLIVVALTLLLYKKLHILIDKINFERKTA